MLAKIEALKEIKMSNVDIHFTVERVFYRIFVGAVSTLEYRSVATFLREQIVLAIEEAEQKTGTVFLKKKKNMAFPRETNRKRLKMRAPRTESSAVQVHVYVSSELQTAFLLAIQALGYSSIAELFREKMRLAIDNAGRTMGYSLRLRQERIGN